MHISSIIALVIACGVAASAGWTPGTPNVGSTAALPSQYLFLNWTKAGQMTSNLQNPAFYYLQSSNVAAAGSQLLIEVKYNKSLTALGWDLLYVGFVSPVTVDLGVMYYAAGLAEGMATADVIVPSFTNLTAGLSATQVSWIAAQHTYLTTKVAANPTDAFWVQVGRILAQLAGLADGVNAAKIQGAAMFRFFDFLTLNLNDEIGDIQIAVTQNNWTSAAGPQNGHCSALVKILPDDLFFSHDTWSSYVTMYRQYKIYAFETVVHISGYPGIVASGDDWYMTSAQLAIMETTNEVFNTSLYVNVVPTTVPEFIRVMAATYLSTTAQQWAQTFARENSGTYNNQYMILDMKLYTPGAALADNLFWVAEQIPGQVELRDQTQVLRDAGYWASYNVAFYKSNYDLSGYQQQEDAVGTFWSYNETCRANIFRREQPNVTDLPSMQRLMRYNHWETDPQSLIPNCKGTPGGKCNPDRSSMLAIASRGDLAPANGNSSTMGPIFNYFSMMPFGAIDSKIATWKNMQNKTMLVGVVQSGPTHDTQPAMKWSDVKKTLNVDKPWGLPDEMKFDWVAFTATATPPTIAPTTTTPLGPQAGVATNSGLAAGVIVGALAVVVVLFFAVRQFQKHVQASFGKATEVTPLNAA